MALIQSCMDKILTSNYFFTYFFHNENQIILHRKAFLYASNFSQCNIDAMQSVNAEIEITISVSICAPETLNYSHLIISYYELSTS